MATTFYASVTVAPSTMADVSHSGTSSTAADILELRMGNGTYAPDRAEVLKFLHVLERWIVQGGLSSAGASLPQPTGPA